MADEEVKIEETAEVEKPQGGEDLEAMKHEILARLDEIDKRIAKIEADEARDEDEEGEGYEDEKIGF